MITNLQTPHLAVAAARGSSLRAITRLWVSGATGVLRWPGIRQTGIRICRGGVVDIADADALGLALRAPRVQFDPCAVPGPSDRREAARRIVAEALRTVANERPDGEFDEFTLLAPPAVLEELGLYPELRWPFEEATREELEPRRVLELRLLALSCLGLARVRTAPPPDPEPAPWRELRPPPTAQPLAVTGPVTGPLTGAVTSAVAQPVTGPLPAVPGAVLTPPPDGWFLDPALLGGDSDGTGIDDHEIELAASLVRTQHWEAAERLLLELRDRRLDHPQVLALLAIARAGDLDNITHERVSEAQRWLRLARALGGADLSPLLLDGYARIEEANLALDEAARREARAPIGPTDQTNSLRGAS